MTDTLPPQYFGSKPPKRRFWPSFRAGLRRRCPACHQGKSFAGYLKIADHCDSCAEPVGNIRCDDVPPYFTITIVGHIVVPLIVYTESRYHPPEWLHMAIWPALTLMLTLILLPYIKGGVLGAMWGLDITGHEHQGGPE
ncbi:MAG: hypothetical protein CMF31_07535 [Kordiimonas sp.]|nr:hypothetical protein [Kordiimonas sp.]|tara:strand:+ start:1756 stop:2172 length:417 start_codon:yes stop_codon:yes gene_type:complete